MTAYRVRFEVPGRISPLVMFVLAPGKAEAIATAVLNLDHEGEEVCSLLDSEQWGNDPQVKK